MTELVKYDNGIEGYPLYTVHNVRYTMIKDSDNDSDYYITRTLIKQDDNYVLSTTDRRVVSIHKNDMMKAIRRYAFNHYNQEDGFFYVPTSNDSIKYSVNDYIAYITRYCFGYLAKPTDYHAKKIRRAFQFTTKEWRVFVDKMLFVYGIFVRETIEKYTIAKGTNN